MSSLKPLVMMQLKDKIDLSFLKSKKQTIFKTVFFLLGLVVITAIAYLLFYVAQMLKLFSIVGFIPVSVMVVIVTIIMILSILSCTYGLMKTLYFSPDNPVLLTLPVNAVLIFASKLIVFYIYEFIKNITYVLPIFIAYGLITSFPITYYFWIIVCLFIISAIPVAIGALLSIPAMAISMLLKKFSWLQIIVSALVVGIIVYLIFKAILILPENLNIVGRWGYISSTIRNFLSNFEKTMIPFTWITMFIVGTRTGLLVNLFSLQTLYIGLGLIVSLVIILALCFLICHKLFLVMASKPFEYRKKTIRKVIANKKYNPFISSLISEAKRNFRTPDILYTTIVIFFALPIAIFFFNRLLSAMNTNLLGQYMVYSFNILIMLLILLTSNATLSSIYSREGLAGPLAKTRPVNPLITLISKLVWIAVFSSVSILFTMIIFQKTMPIEFGSLILLNFTILFINLSHILWSAEFDFMNPQYQQYATFGESASNPNDKKSTISAFILAFLFFIIALFLLDESYTITWFKLFIIASVWLVARVYMFISKAKYYYREII